MTDLPRSAGRFPAIKNEVFEPHSQFPGPFKATHTHILTQKPVEVLARNVMTWGTLYPVVIIRDRFGTVFTVPEESFDAVKRKNYVNFQPLED
jgi:hypothetical protein